MAKSTGRRPHSVHSARRKTPTKADVEAIERRLRGADKQSERFTDDQSEGNNPGRCPPPPARNPEEPDDDGGGVS